MENVSIAKLKIKKCSVGQLIDAEDELAVEEPLEIQLSYTNDTTAVLKTIAITMRTPGNDAELAIGFLFTEGIIRRKNQLADIYFQQLTNNTILITLGKTAQPGLNNTERNFYTTSSCGVCGKTSIESIKTVSIYKNSTDSIRLPAAILYNLQNTLVAQQAVFESTGGLHAAAIFDVTGKFKTLREDVGRHNALDKVIGNALLNETLPLDSCILLLSGRASFELIQKAAMAGIKIVVAIGAPSSLAVKLAAEMGMTLVGFLKKQRFNIYCGEERIEY